MGTPYAQLMWRIIDPANRLIGRWRAAAVERLELKSGDWVIDAGCGTGSSFPYLLKAVDPSGHVVGIEMDRFLADKAQSRIHHNDWRNVHVIQADAQAVAVRPQFDGLLMFAAHEVLTSLKALNNLFAGLKEHARVVAFGAKQTNSLPGRAVNPLLHLASKHWLPYSSPIATKPWSLLETRVDQLVVEEHLFGIFYLVSGTLSLATPKNEAECSLK
jgi:ubiquinone/menaquinone biosynthesis C-methylase UbiE